MRTSFSVNDMTIHRIVEQEAGFTPILEFLPSLSRDLLDENRSWMEPAALDPAGMAVLWRFSTAPGIICPAGEGDSSGRPGAAWGPVGWAMGLRVLFTCWLGSGACPAPPPARSLFSCAQAKAPTTVPTTSSQTPATDAVLLCEFIFESAPYPSCHAATIAQSKSGGLVAR